MFGKRQVATLVAEFLGTGILTMLILSVKYSQLGSSAFFVGAAAGLTLTLLTFMFLNVSGGNFNPAVTIGLWVAKKVPGLTALLYVVAQSLGAYAAYSLFKYFVVVKLPSASSALSTKVLIAEIIGTLIFTLGIGAVVYQKFSLGASAAATGLSLMIGIVAVSAVTIGLQQQDPNALYSVGVLNPAIAIGASLSAMRDVMWGGTLLMYVVGPILGGLVGINGYKYLFAEGGANITMPAEATKTVKSKKAPAKKATKKKTTRKK
jgi:aquaporin Z